MDQVNNEAEPNDAELIRAFAAGDENGFTVLYNRYRRQLYGYLHHLIVSNPSEVDEVFEETWLRVIEKLPKYRDEGRFSAWLFRMARNLYIDRIRRTRKENTPLDEEILAETEGIRTDRPEEQCSSRELGELIGRAVAGLAPEQREVFLLRQQELSFREIAEIQQCSLNTVLSRMQYALKNLRRSVAEIDGGAWELE